MSDPHRRSTLISHFFRCSCANINLTWLIFHHQPYLTAGRMALAVSVRPSRNSSQILQFRHSKWHCHIYLAKCISVICRRHIKPTVSVPHISFHSSPFRDTPQVPSSRSYHTILFICDIFSRILSISSFSSFKLILKRARSCSLAQPIKTTNLFISCVRYCLERFSKQVTRIHSVDSSGAASKCSSHFRSLFTPETVIFSDPGQTNNKSTKFCASVTAS